MAITAAISMSEKAGARQTTLDCGGDLTGFWF
jgi:hypothetical protein